MRNYKKHRSTVIDLFQSFLAGKINKKALIYELIKIEVFDLKGEVKRTDKQLWFRFFKNDTLATTIYNIEKDIDYSTNSKYIKECMQIAIDNPKGLSIHYS